MGPPGEFINIWFFMDTNGMLCMVTNVWEIKVCEAPESKRTVAGMELMSNIPIITSGDSRAVEVDMWFTFPELGVG